MSSVPVLPIELWLEVLKYVDPSDLWLSARSVSRNFRTYAEDVAAAQLIQRFSISLKFTLGSSNRRHWYDSRGSVRFQFKKISKHNPQYAEFDAINVLPEACSQQAWEKWNRICVDGIGPHNSWRVKIDDDEDVDACLPKLIISQKHGIWCDWREMLNVYYKEVGSPFRRRRT